MIKTRLIIISSILSVVMIFFGILIYFLFDKNSLVPKESNYENYCDYFVSRLKFEQKKIKLKHSGDSIRIDYDFNQYFKIFDQLRLEQDWKIIFHYFYNGDAGRPLLMAIHQNDSIDQLFNNFNDKYYILKYNDSINFIEHIRINGNQNGYYQLLILALMGDNFSLFWHSGYGSIDIISSKRSIRELILRHKSDDFAKVAEYLKKIDVKPVFTDLKDSILINLKDFNDWTGLTERVYSIKKTFPHKIKVIKDTVLVKYDCGILF